MNTNTIVNSSNSTTGDTSIGQTNEAFLAQFKSDTGWDYGDAVAMAVECRTEDRLFGNRFSPMRRNLRNRTRRSRNETADQKFLRQTGWTFADAMDVASEAQRENRIFGSRLN